MPTTIHSLAHTHTLLRVSPRFTSTYGTSTHPSTDSQPPMHAPTTILTLLLAATVSAKWHMKVSYSDGTSLKFDGHTNSGCKRFKKTNAKVTNVDFDSSLLADTFELFTDAKCRQLGYKGSKKGSQSVPNHVYQSYKVY